jgi:WD40 repeat protein
VAAVALSPDGMRLAASRSDHTALVWDLGSGDLVTLQGPANHIAYGVSFSPDGKRLVSLHRPGESELRAGAVLMKVWDLDSRKSVVTVDRLPATTQGASFSPDGKRLVVYSRRLGTVAVYDAETGREAFSCKDPGKLVFGAAFSPDGKRLATSAETGVRIWDVATQQVALVWESDGFLFNLTYSPDGGFLVATNIDGVAQIWDTATGQKVQTFKGHSGRVSAMAFSPDGSLLATGGADGTLRLWDTTAPADAAAISRPTSGSAPLVPDLSPDGRCLLTYPFGPESKRVELWDTATRSMRGGPIELAGPLIDCAWSADGERLYLADEGKTVSVVQTASGAVVRRFPVDAETRNYAAAVSPDEQWYAHSGARGTIRVREARTGTLSRTIQGLGDELQALGFSPDGSRLLGVDDSGVLKIFDFATGREVVATNLSRVYVDNIRFSKDGTRVAVVGNRTPLITGEVRILDAFSAREVWSLEGHSRNVTDADFSPDGRRLATAGADMTIRIWDLATGQEILKPSGCPNVISLRFVSGGHRLIGGGLDRAIFFWDATPLPE